MGSSCLAHKDCFNGYCLTDGYCASHLGEHDPCKRLYGTSFCSTGYHCDADTSRCKVPGWKRPETYRNEYDCPVGWHCSYGKCQPGLTTCSREAECADGYSCSSNICKKRCRTTADCITGKCGSTLMGRFYGLCFLDKPEKVEAAREKSKNHVPGVYSRQPRNPVQQPPAPIAKVYHKEKSFFDLTILMIVGVCLILLICCTCIIIARRRRSRTTATFVPQMTSYEAPTSTLPYYTQIPYANPTLMVSYDSLAPSSPPMSTADFQTVSGYPEPPAYNSSPLRSPDTDQDFRHGVSPDEKF